MRLAGFVLVAALTLASCRDEGGGGDSVSVIAGFNGAVDPATFEAHGGTVVLRNDAISFLAGPMPAANVAALRAEPNVRYVEEDGVATASGRQSTQTMPWGVAHIAADYSWTTHGAINGSDGAWGAAHTTQNHDTTPGVTRIRVAILDTGINLGHEDIVGQAVWGTNLAGPPNTDVDGHGTHVAGTVAARDNLIGVVGVAPCALAVAVKVLGNNGRGSFSAVASGITWAADNNCQVINMSLGADSGAQVLLDAVNDAWTKNVVICAAAGNDGTSTPDFPASYANCISVVATTSADVRAWFSNYGSTTDLSAPGEGILSTTKSGYASWNGTSMACPHVAGVAALVWAKVLQQSNASIKTNAYVRGRLETDAAGPIDGGAIPNLVDPWSCLVNVPQ